MKTPSPATIQSVLTTLRATPHRSMHRGTDRPHEFCAGWDRPPLVTRDDVKRMLNLGYVRMEKCEDGWEYVTTERDHYSAQRAGEQMAALATFEHIHRDPATAHRFGRYHAVASAPPDAAQIICAWQEPGVAVQVTALPRKRRDRGVTEEELRMMRDDPGALLGWVEYEKNNWYHNKEIEGHIWNLRVRQLSGEGKAFVCYAGQILLGSAASLDEAKSKCERLERSGHEARPEDPPKSAKSQGSREKPTPATPKKDSSPQTRTTTVKGLRNGRVVVLKEGNPHKAGSTQHERFKVLQKSKTVQDFLDDPLGESHMIHNLTKLGWIRVDDM